MSTVSLHNRNRGQRLRGGWPDMPPPPGSRGCAPGELRHLLPSCCSNPRRVSISPGLGLAASVRLCECMPWNASRMKSAGLKGVSEIPAKIAVFFVKALSQRALPLQNYCSNGLEAVTRTFPPFFPQPP